MGQCLGVKKAELRAAASEHRDLQNMNSVSDVQRIICKLLRRVKYQTGFGDFFSNLLGEKMLALG
jgi:hypothetical protein